MIKMVITNQGTVRLATELTILLLLLPTGEALLDENLGGGARVEAVLRERRELVFGARDPNRRLSGFIVNEFSMSCPIDPRRLTYLDCIGQSCGDLSGECLPEAS